MTTAELLAFMRANRLAVQASVSAASGAQAAVVGIAVTDAFELVFDTLDSTRKVTNLRAHPRLAFVIGGTMPGDERTVQYEGVADEPVGPERDRIRAAYFSVWPDGPARAKWPGIVYVRVRPTWVRYSDFNVSPPRVVEFDAQHLTPAVSAAR
ncbi:MAG TPA: pyridoxamine 5'-phosphate oxidase family protein [Gemmatimonadaceae bacterium]|nr:pyridoxamine 5'-phosphate oxidase family protein [Gemmatimonadaceae bacterium]